MRPKSIDIYASGYGKCKKAFDFMSPAENLIRAMKVYGIAPKGRGSRALDFGCGDGRHVEYLSCLGYRVRATDVSREAVAASKKRVGRRSDAEIVFMEHNSRIDSGDSMYELIVSWETMHWLGSKKIFRLYMDEFQRVLRKGGRIIMTMPTEEHFLKYVSIETGESQYLCKAEERDGTIFYSPNLYSLKHMFMSDYRLKIVGVMRYDNGRERHGLFKNLTLDKLFSMYVFILESHA